MTQLLRWIAACIVLISVAVTAQAQPLRIFAAASLKSVLDDLADQYHAKTGQEVNLIYGGSGDLARQISQGAPADGFISANTAWMDWLVDQNLLHRGDVRIVAGNRLVVIAARSDPSFQMRELTSRLGPDARLALGLTRSVPAGIYARSAMEKAGIWPDVQPFVVETSNVRAALAQVALGQAAFGIVYASDVVGVSGVVSLATVDEKLHDPIAYAAAPLFNPDAAQFIEYVGSAEGAVALRRWGFIAR